MLCAKSSDVSPGSGGLRHVRGGAAVGETLSSLDEALFHLALANLPADLRQQRIDEMLDRRLELMHTDA